MYQTSIASAGVGRLQDQGDFTFDVGMGNLIKWTGTAYESGKVTVDEDINNVNTISKATNTGLMWDGLEYVYQKFVVNLLDVEDVSGSTGANYVLIHDGATGWIAQAEPYMRDLVDDLSPVLGATLDGNNKGIDNCVSVYANNYIGVNAWPGGTGWGTSAVPRRCFGTGDPGTMSGAPATAWLEASFTFYGSSMSIAPDTPNNYQGLMQLRSNYGLLAPNSTYRLQSHGGTCPIDSACFFADVWKDPEDGGGELYYSALYEGYPQYIYDIGDGVEHLIVMGHWGSTRACAGDEAGGMYSWNHSADKSDEAHGSMYISSASATTISGISTPVKVAGTTTSNVLNKFTMPANNRLTYGGDNTSYCQVICNISITAATSADNFNFYIAKNGTVEAGSKVVANLPTGDTDMDVTVTWDLNLNSGDYVELWVENTTAARNVTVNTMHMMVQSDAEDAVLWMREVQAKLGRLTSVLHKHGYLKDDEFYQSTGTSSSGTINLTGVTGDGYATPSGSYSNSGVSLQFKRNYQGSNAAGFTDDSNYVFLSFTDPSSRPYVRSFTVELLRWLAKGGSGDWGVIEIMGVNDPSYHSALLSNNAAVMGSVKTNARVFWSPHADGWNAQSGITPTRGTLTTPNLANIISEIRNNSAFTKGTDYLHLIFRPVGDMTQDESVYLEVFGEDYTGGLGAPWTSADWEYIT